MWICLLKDAAHLLVLVSLLMDPQAWAMDAMLLFGENLFLYAYPPISLFGDVLASFDQFQIINVILVARFGLAGRGSRCFTVLPGPSYLLPRC